METTIAFEFDDFINFVIETLDDEQMLHLIEEYDENVANWDFVHKGYLLFRKIIQSNYDEYKEYLENMAVIHEERSIVGIMDELEKDILMKSDLVEDK